MTDGTTPKTGRERLDASEQRAVVRERYGSIAASASSCCGDTDSCGDSQPSQSLERGYTEDDLATVGPGANLGLGCGNPTAIASLEVGETVLDLGFGGGFDCFLAAREVGPSGRVIGVDMTPEMVEKARENVETNDATNVEFRLGEIEHLPVAGEPVDLVMSNCVVNLSPDKQRVFREAARVLKPGGRLVISDIVRTAELPNDIRTDPSSVAACIGGAAAIPELETMLAEAGFENVSIEPDDDSNESISNWDDDHDLEDPVTTATIEATKPAPPIGHAT